MRFFKPDMVNQWNKLDLTGENKAKHDREWDEAQDAYDAHFLRVADDLPRSVRHLNEDCVLFNEAVVSLPRATGFKTGDVYAVVTSSDKDSQLHVLTYTLESPPTIVQHEGDGFDPPALDGVWLYDEFLITEDGHYQHNVLFSNGAELEVKFKTLHWYQADIELQG